MRSTEKADKYFVDNLLSVVDAAESQSIWFLLTEPFLGFCRFEDEVGDGNSFRTGTRMLPIAPP